MSRRIFVIDDNEVILELFRNFLKDEDYEVCTFPNPMELVCFKSGTNSECCDADKCCAHAVFTDCNMPGMNGLEFIKHLKNKKCKIKNVGLMTAYPENFLALDSDLYKNIQFFQKPFTVDEVLSWLKMCED